jgi:putative iron-regulated protein
MRIFFFFSLMLSFSCSPKNEIDFRKTLNPNDFSRLESRVVQNYAEQVYLSYQSALSEAKKLSASLRAFVTNPDEEGFRRAQNAWLKAREAYALTEAFRFYQGPIDSPSRGVEIYLNSWPLDESYIDYVQGQPSAGIINKIDLYPEISKEVLLKLNRKDGNKNISTGYHAMEFLLWGQDFDPDLPGSRAFTDYVIELSPMAQRRGQYLVVLGDLIEGHLAYLVEEWAVKDDNFRALFLRQSAKRALTQVMKGVSDLIADELIKARVDRPFNTRSQEDEKCRFSDSTLEDLFWSLTGAENVYLGQFQGLDGPGVSHLVALEKPSLDLEIKNHFDLVKRSLRRISVPFDQAIVRDPLRPLLEELLQQLHVLSNKIKETKNLLDLEEH